tara:strand:- start:11 stop:430 length:420 start_codon:yes stop_codon:yes gene_type:complete
LQNLLDKAITIAVECHAGQTNKIGEPYILHPLRMMFKADTVEEKIVAILHDVIEKTDMDFKKLHAAGFNHKILSAIDSLSRKVDENYNSYLDRVKKNKLAKKIKIIDLNDNLKSVKNSKIEERINTKLLKYQNAINKLS